MQVNEKEKGKKVFITGGTGFLGKRIIDLMGKKFSIFSHYRSAYTTMPDNFPKFDLLERKKVFSVMQTCAPDVIIHTAALTNVDFCEENPHIAFEQNVKVTENVMSIAETLGATLIYISTDQVFDGKKGLYKENEPVNPVNIYGRTKAMAEEKVLKSMSSAAIIRTNFYGYSHRSNLSFAQWILKGCKENRRLRMFTNVFFTPLYIDNLIDVIIEIVCKKSTGIYHLASPYRISKYGFGKKLANIFGLKGNNITPVEYDINTLRAPRPLDMSLCCEKAKSEFETDLLTCSQGLQMMKRCLSKQQDKGVKR